MVSMIRYEMTLSTKRGSEDLPLGTRRVADWLFGQAQIFAKAIGARVEAIEQTVLNDVSGAVRLQIVAPLTLDALESLPPWQALNREGIDIKARTAGVVELDESE
jgi:hypothetical protein